MTQNIDKILERAAKLLSVQTGRGASETEAAVAAEHLQRLLQDHNLSLSQIEQHAGNGEGPVTKRVKDEMKGRVYQPWITTLITGIATNNFCLAVSSSTKDERGKRTSGVKIVGRELNINVTKMTFNYLSEALRRAAQEHGLKRIFTPEHDGRREYDYFMEGAVARVIERLNRRRLERELEDAKNSENVTGNGTHRELVLADVYGTEADLNNDALNGFAPGTTAANRRSLQERQKLQKQEHDRLVADGVDDTVAWYRAYGYSEERAVSLAKDYAESSRRTRSGNHSHTAHNWSRSDRAHYRKINSTSYKRGVEAGNSVGLDPQVGGSSQKRIR